jgi:hypothetical protein
MDRLKTMLDQHAAQLSQAEPYFAPNFERARVLLDGAQAGNGGLSWASGAVCGAQGCSCGNRGCLHMTAWRVFRGK